MIVRWGLAELGPLLSELGIRRPFLVTTERFRDFGVPEAEPPLVAAGAAARPGARANPRAVSPDDALSLLQSIW